MSHFATALFAGIIATALIGGPAFMPMPAEAAKMSKADKIALKEATVACKPEARGKKVRWIAGRKFGNTGVAKALKGHPNITISHLRRGHRNLNALRGITPPDS